MFISKNFLPANKQLYSAEQCQPEHLKLNHLAPSICQIIQPKKTYPEAIADNKEVTKNSTSRHSAIKKESFQTHSDEASKYSIQSQACEKLEPEQFLFHARQMEQARLALIKLILQTPDSVLILADCYLKRIEQGVDQSELFSLSYGKDNAQAVQDNSSVQVNAKQFGIELAAMFHKIIAKKKTNSDFNNSSAYLKQLAEIHFLPVFIQQVVTRMLDHQDLSQHFKTILNRQLSRMLEPRQIIINSNLRMVAFIVNKYKHDTIAFSDVMQEGTIGLIKAVDRFDYNRAVKFSTYAVYWIRQMISRTITKQKKLVSLPFNLACKVSSVYEAISNSLHEHNKWPSTLELAKSCELSVREVESIMESYQPCISLSSHVNNDEDSPLLLDMLEQHHYPSALSELSKSGLNSILEQAIDSLPEREAYVLRCRFGMNNDIELTLQDIANQFDISKERIRQIQNKALHKLREQYGDELNDFLSLAST